MIAGMSSGGSMSPVMPRWCSISLVSFFVHQGGAGPVAGASEGLLSECRGFRPCLLLPQVVVRAFPLFFVHQFLQPSWPVRRVRNKARVRPGPVEDGLVGLVPRQDRRCRSEVRHPSAPKARISSFPGSGFPVPASLALATKTPTYSARLFFEMEFQKVP